MTCLELIARARAGDRRAFEPLVRELAIVAYALVGDIARTRELVIVLVTSLDELEAVADTIARELCDLIAERKAQ